MEDEADSMGDSTKDIVRDVLALGGDIVSSARFAKAGGVAHHGRDLDIATHSTNTALRALQIARWLEGRGVPVDERDVVRAALLHDIGMTEDEVLLSPSPVKARSHPREGARIAREEYGANDVQAEAIEHHMWPLCLVPPQSVVAWVVTAADKRCSVQEAASMVLSALRWRGGADNEEVG